MMKVWLNIKVSWLFLSRLLVMLIALSFLSLGSYSQDADYKVSDFKVNSNQAVSPGQIIASCVVAEGGDIPYKRYALIYTAYENDSIKMLLEKTVVSWTGWGWSEVSWFSPVTERRSCRAHLWDRECRVDLAPEAAVKLKLIDAVGNIQIRKLNEFGS